MLVILATNSGRSSPLLRSSSLSAYLCGPLVASQIAQEVARKYHNSVAAAEPLTSLPIPKCPVFVIEDGEENIEYSGMSLLDLIEEQHRAGIVAYRAS